MDRLLQMSVVALGATLASTASADMVKVADTIDDFASVQGQDNWSYGWYAGSDVGLTGGAGSLDTNNFQEFGHYDSGIGWWTHDDASASSGSGATPFFLTVITSQFMHANAPIAGSDVDGQSRWASRRWSSEVAGDIQITGQIAKVDQGPLLGDGAEAYVIVDGAVAYHYALGADDYAGTSFDLTVNVGEGSLIEFVLGGNASGLNDAALFTAKIDGTVPAPGAVALLGMGGLLVGRRRR